MTKNQQTALSSGCDNYLHTECGYPDKCTCRCHKIDQIRGRQKWRANAQRQIGRSPEDSQSYSDIDFLLSENERLSIAAPQDEQDAERDQAFREFWRECEQAVPHHPSRAAEFATFTKRYKAPAPSATTNTAPSFVEEFTQAAIQAHIGFKHETRWDECDISSCSERRTMIESLRAAPSSQSLAIKAAEEIREWLGITGLVDGNGIKEVAAIIQKHYELETKKA